MPRNQPTGSLTGRSGWEWNRLQAAESAKGTATKTESNQQETTETQTTQSKNHTTHSATEHRCSYRKENVELRRRVQQLEAELVRRDRHLQSVIDTYERLLADWQTRQKPGGSTDDGQSSSRTADDQLPPVLSRLFEYAENR